MVGEEAPGVGLVLESRDDVIGKADQDDMATGLPHAPMVRPDTDDTVQVDVRQQCADHRSLWRAGLTRAPLSVFWDPRLEPLAHKPEDALVADPVQASPQPRRLRPETSRFPYGERPRMPGSLTTPGRQGTRAGAPRRVAFRPSDGVGARLAETSRLNGWPARSPADASPTPSRMPAHRSGPMWVDPPSSCWLFTTSSMPVSRRWSRRRCVLRPSTRVARPTLERGARSASPSPARTDVSGEPRNGQYTPHAQISLASLPTPGERGGTPPDTAYFRLAGAVMALRRPASHQAARKPLRPPLLTPKPSAATQPSIVATKVLSPPHRLVPAALACMLCRWYRLAQSVHPSCGRSSYPSQSLARMADVL